MIRGKKQNCCKLRFDYFRGKLVCRDVADNLKCKLKGIDYLIIRLFPPVDFMLSDIVIEEIIEKRRGRLNRFLRWEGTAPIEPTPEAGFPVGF